jgi:integrase
MRGSLQRAKVSVRTQRAMKKGEGAWNLILSLGRGEDGKYKQKWIRFHGTREQAQKKLTELVGEVHHGEFIEPSKLTVGQYLDEWLVTAVKPRRAANTYYAYTVIVKHLKRAFGDVPLQKLSPMQIERYYADSKLAPASLALHHAVLSTALKAAVLKGILRSNAASRVANKPHIVSKGDVLKNVWTADEARLFLQTVKDQAGEQDAALFAVALDSGARKSELLGLKWTDFDGNKMRIERQLATGGLKDPTYTTPKRGGVRSIDLSDETIQLLQNHKRKQAELKMANRTRYRDHGLVFAQAWEHINSTNSLIGAPLHHNAVNKRLTSLARTAGVKAIKPHGLRHTCATLLLLAGVPAHVVQRRLGHTKVEMTLNIYSHVLPSMQEDAASRLATLLHG